MSKKGFTLVEILVAIALIGIIAVAFLPLLTFSYTHLLDAKRYTTDLNAIQQEVEKKMEIARNNTPVAGNPDVATVSVFGKTVTAHVIQQEIQSGTSSAHGKINALVPKDNVVYNEPALSNVTINAYVGGSLVSNPQFLFPVNTGISFSGSTPTVVSYPDDYLMSVYRWYMSPVMDIGDTSPPTDIREWIILKEWNEARTPLSYAASNNLTFIPNIEANYNQLSLSEFAFLPGDTAETIANRFSGRYFVYSVTPYSTIGRVGVEVFSNPISTNRISSIRDTVNNEIRVQVEWVRSGTYLVSNLSSLQANMIDGTIQTVNVDWASNSIPITSPTQPDVTVNGTILGYPPGVKLILDVVDEIDNNPGTTSIVGPTKALIPRSGSTTIPYTAEVYNLAGVPLPGEPVTWSITSGNPTSGAVSLNSTTGVLTIPSTATARTITIRATTSNPLIFATLNVVITKPGQVNAANSSVSFSNIRVGSYYRARFEVTVLDSDNNPISGLTMTDFQMSRITSASASAATLQSIHNNGSYDVIDFSDLGNGSYIWTVYRTSGSSSETRTNVTVTARNYPDYSAYVTIASGLSNVQLR